MIIFWMRKSDKDRLPQPRENTDDSFREHDELMKKFRVAHPGEGAAKTEELHGTANLTLVPLPPVKVASYSRN